VPLVLVLVNSGLGLVDGWCDSSTIAPHTMSLRACCSICRLAGFSQKTTPTSRCDSCWMRATHQNRSTSSPSRVSLA
jgi:hypothetical protein